MSGKAYTMKEMKAIVDYLVEHKAYGTIKGRKMWIDFSNSPITSRSWQSLKETFLKRILPDIHNPYYKLTREQVQSFRQGIDVQERERNKLEMQVISDDSGSNAEIPNGNEQPGTSKNGEEQTGEGIASKINSRNRSSVDTVILDTCYETAEDVLRDLESPSSSTKSKDDPIKSQSKSLRDLITYSEPLTPMLQEVLHDFASSDDSDSGDPKMQIVENVSETEPGNESPRNLPDPVNEYVQINEDQGNKNDLNESDNFIEPKVKSLRLRKRQGVYEPVGEQKSLEKVIAAADKPFNSDDNKTNSNENIVEDVSEPSIITVNDSEKTVDKPSKSNAQSTQNCSSSTTDSVLPNNQEALDAKKVTDSKNESSNLNQTNANVNTVTRKRTVSREMHTSQITNLEDKTNQQHVPISDTVMHEKTHSTNNSDVVVNASETVVDQVKETNATGEHTRKSSEIDTQDILPPNKTAKELNTSTQTSQINPCLQSVSLFAEQFNITNYLESESSNNEGEPSTSSTKQSPEKPLDVIEKRNGDANEVVVLKSHSETESDTNKEKPNKKNSNNQGVSKSKRDKVLANMFGFSSGAVTSKRKKLPSYHKNSASHHFHGHNSSTNSSEWTSESDSDYVSPPRAHRNRPARKYQKLKSARIHSLEDEGGLFVMYGKKIYPLVKDGRSITNYLVYSPDSESDNEENFWKQKYVEQRQRVEELKKFIKQSKKDTERDPSPLLPTRSSRTLMSQVRHTKSKTISVSDSDKDPAPKEEIQNKEPVVENKNKTLKITFAKNNQEVHLEGHWSQLHPVLADVVEIFHKDTNASEPSIKKSEPSTKKSEPSLPEATRAKSPVVLAPIDEEAHEKINKLETEIFKEIEEIANEGKTETKNSIENNVTKRKRPNRISSSSTEASNAQDPSPEPTRSSKRAKTTKKTEEVNNVNEEKDLKVEEEENKSKESPNKVEQKATETPSKTRVATKRTRTPRKEPGETVNAIVSNENKPKTRRYNLAIAEEAKHSVNDDEADVRYKFPPTKKSAKNSTPPSVGKANEPTKRYSINIHSIFSPPDSSLHSESTQGYQDSDVSPPKILYRRKRRLSVSTVQCKNKNKHNRLKRSLPIITTEHSSDSNNSYHIILKPDCSLKSEDYRSESYQMLMGNKRNNILKPLDKIEEDSSPSNNNLEIKNLDIPSNSEIVKSKISLNITNDLSPTSSNTNGDGGNSSNISLPLSPELSMVENLSVSKELINRKSNHPTLNELHLNDVSNNTSRKYLISQVDVTMPLMQQECGVYISFDGNIRSASTDNETKNPVVTESLVNKINTVNIKEFPSLSDSLDTRLKNLFLESAKKMSKSDESNKEIPTNKEEAVKKTRSKRCSTPRKKKDTLADKSAKVRKVDPVIEEECMEFCIYGGRKSCPPSIHNIINNENDINEILTDITAENATKDKSKVKKKKDIIKVKITRPSKNMKTKSNKRESSLNKAKSISRASIPINSEINESGISSQDFSDGIDLIHNHSETCLQANECIGDSVEFLEMTAKSIISVNSDSSTSCDCKEHKQVFQDCTDISLFCNNARDGSTPCKINQVVPAAETTGDTVYHSPSDMSLTSLITEDLSDEIRSSQSSKWYLLSEEVTNTNAGPENKHGFSAHLKQLFPLTCAVPDLSTITEMSKENDDSRKPTLEASSCNNNTMNDIDSQNVFDMNL